jgi:predicted metal-dependent peptidase
MQDTPAEDTPNLPVRRTFDKDSLGDELIKKLKEEAQDDETWLAARDEFVRRASEFELYPVVYDLLNEEPFYGSISRRINKVKSMRIPTAAVTVMNDLFLMMWNPTFFTRIAPDFMKGAGARLKVQGVLIHEFLHLILQHVTLRREGIEFPIMWNWATDLAINCMIDREKLPDGLLIPGEALDIPEDAAAAYRPEDVEQYKQLSQFICDLPVKLTSEDYYNRLLSWVKKNAPEMMTPEWGMPQDSGAGGAGGQGQCSCDDGDEDGEGGDSGEGGEGGDSGEGGEGGDQGGDGQGDGNPGDDHKHGENGKPCDHSGGKATQSGGQGGQQADPNCPVHGKGKKTYTSGRGRLGQFDDHDKWDEVSDAERDFIRQRVKNMLRDAVNEADNDLSGKGWGSVPSEMQSQLRKLISDQIDWRALLRQFVGYSQHMNKSSTMKKLNRRYQYIHPGRRRSRGAKLRVYIDQSGSVSNDDISLLFGELDNLSKKVDFEVYFFDTEVDTNPIMWKRGQKHPAQRRRSGGTDFNAPTRHANENREGVDGILILTDGECYEPEPSVLKRAWVITPDRKLLFDTSELVIQMDRPKNHEGA